jgi:KAP family P-loop domain
MSSYSIEHVLMNPGNIPEPLEEHVASILSMIDKLDGEYQGQSELQDKSCQAFLKANVTEGSRTLSIAGDRGCGKSLLLHYVCANLLNNKKHYVCPIIKPERFGKGDTAIGWVLAALQRSLGTTDFGVEILDSKITFCNQDMTFRESLDVLAQHDALIHRPYGQGLTHQDVTQAEFARDAASLNKMGYDFAHNWGQWVTFFLDKIKQHPDNEIGQLVIPIDDADLVPNTMRDVLSAINLMSSSKRVVFILCLGTDELNELFSDNSADKRFMPRNQRIKHFPISLRTELKILTPKQRLEFAPIGSELTMLNMLKKIPLIGIEFLDNAADLYDLGPRIGLKEIIPSYFTEGFPSIPRALEQLYETLERLVSSGLKEQALSSEAFHFLVSQCLESCEPEWKSLVPPPVKWIKNCSEYTVELDCREFRTGANIGRGRGISIENNGPQGRIRRSIQDYLGSYCIVNKKDDSEKAQRLPLGFSESVLLAKMLSEPGEDRVFGWDGQYGSIMLQGGGAWTRYMSVTVGPEDTDGSFWLVPDWENSYDYYLYGEIWNRTVHRFSESDLQYAETHTNILEWVFLLHLKLVCSIEQGRTIKKNIWDQSSKQLADMLDNNELWKSFQKQRRDEIKQEIASLYANGQENLQERRKSDFCTWVEIMLPFAADRLSLPAETGNWVLEIREEILKRHDQLADSDESLAKALVRRIHRHIENRWVYFTIDLLEEFDPAQAAWLRSMVEQQETQRNEKLQAFVRRLGEVGIPESLQKRILAFGVTQEIGRELQAAGIPGDYIDLAREVIKRDGADDILKSSTDEKSMNRAIEGDGAD